MFKSLTKSNHPTVHINREIPSVQSLQPTGIHVTKLSSHYNNQTVKSWRLSKLIMVTKTVTCRWKHEKNLELKEELYSKCWIRAPWDRVSFNLLMMCCCNSYPQIFILVVRAKTNEWTRAQRVIDGQLICFESADWMIYMISVKPAAVWMRVS